MLILIILLLIILIAVSIISHRKIREYKKILKKQRQFTDRSNTNFKLFKRILWLEKQGLSLSDYLLENGYRNIAIYGFSDAGEYLSEELKDTAVNVLYAIDKREVKLHSDIPLKKPEDSLPKVDAIIVTAVFYYSEIEEALRNRVECPMLSLEDILYEII